MGGSGSKKQKAGTKANNSPEAKSLASAFTKFDKDKKGYLTMEDFSNFISSIPPKSELGKALGLDYFETAVAGKTIEVGFLGLEQGFREQPEDALHDHDKEPSPLYALIFGLCYLYKHPLGVSLPEVKFYCGNRAKASRDLTKCPRSQSYTSTRYDAYKIVVVGEVGSGKTSLISKFCRNQQTLPHADVRSAYADYGRNTFVKFHVWDPVGRDRFKSDRRSYWEAASGVLFVCDLTNKQSLDTIDKWKREAERRGFGDHLTMLVVGTKCDLRDEFFEKKDKERREWMEERIQTEEHGIPYLETSAKTGKNVYEAFLTLGCMMMEQHAGDFEEYECRPRAELVADALQNGSAAFLGCQHASYFYFFQHPKSPFSALPKEIRLVIFGLWYCM